MNKKNILLTTVIILIVSLILITAISFATTIIDNWSVSTQSEWNSVFSTASENTTIQNSSLQVEDQRWQLEHLIYKNNKNTRSTQPRGLFWKPDGTKLYTIGANDNLIVEHKVSNPWDITTATYVKNISTQNSDPEDLFWKPDGTKLYELGRDGTNDYIYEYRVLDPWNLSSAVYNSITFSGEKMHTEDSQPRGLFWKPDGTKLYTIGGYNNNIYHYEVSTPWNLTSATYTGNKINTTNNDARDIFWKPDGTKLYEIDSGKNLIYEYEVSDPWNLKTATNTGNKINTKGTDSFGISWKPDGTKLYELGMSNNTIYQYDAPSPSSGVFTSEWHVYDNKRVIQNVTQGVKIGSEEVEVKIETYSTDTASTSETNWMPINSNGTVTKELGSIEGDRVRVKYRFTK